MMIFCSQMVSETLFVLTEEHRLCFLIISLDRKKKNEMVFSLLMNTLYKKISNFLKKKKKMPALKWNQDGIEEWETQF